MPTDAVDKATSRNPTPMHRDGSTAQCLSPFKLYMLEFPLGEINRGISSMKDIGRVACNAKLNDEKAADFHHERIVEW